MEIAEVYEAIRPRYPELKGRVALVTGSSRGIGKAIALRLAREGMKIVIHGVDAAEVTTTVSAFESLGVDVTGMTIDFSAPDAAEQVFATFNQHHDTLELLVNNAADLRRTNIDDATIDMLDHQLTVNLRTPYLCSLQALSLMRPAKRGAIVNISSVGGQRAHWKGLPYDATKGGIDAMTRAMAIEAAPDGVRVNAIAPGAIHNDRVPPPDHPKVQEWIARIPMGRLGDMIEIGAAVAFLASDDARYITGQILSVDGGITAQISPPGQPI